MQNFCKMNSLNFENVHVYVHSKSFKDLASVRKVFSNFEFIFMQLVAGCNLVATWWQLGRLDQNENGNTYTNYDDPTNEIPILLINNLIHNNLL